MGPPRAKEKLTRFLAPGARIGQKILLEEKEAHHLKNVRRLRVGNEILVLDLQGQEFLAQIEEIKRDEVWIRPKALKRKEEKPSPPIVSILPLLKKDFLGFLTEKAVELGINSLILVETSRSVLRPSPSLRDKLLRRALQALKQCGRLWPLEILGPYPLERLENLEVSLKILASFEGTQSPVFPASSLKEGVALFSGPEGGFEKEELLFLRDLNFKEYSLGSYTLRAETAAFYLMCLAHWYLRRN